MRASLLKLQVCERRKERVDHKIEKDCNYMFLVKEVEEVAVVETCRGL